MTKLPINNEPDGHPGLDRIIQQVKDKHHPKHSHGPYIVTEWEYEEQYIYHEGTGQSSIIPGTCKAITYRCSICLEPREENKQ